MEFVRNCGTGIQTQSGWSNFVCEVYATRLSNEDTDPTDLNHRDETEHIYSNILTEIESILRRENYIVLANYTTQDVLVFLPIAEHNAFNRKSPDLNKLLQGMPVKTEIKLRTVFSTTDLTSQQQLRRHVVATSTPQTHGGGFGDGESDITRKSEIYGMLINALSHTLAYRIAKHSDFLPLGRNVFVSALSSRPPRSNQRAPSYVTAIGISIYLTSTGILVISAFPIPSPRVEIICSSTQRNIPISGLPILLAPLGQRAILEYRNHESTSLRYTSSWKVLILAWLSKLAIPVPSMEDDKDWVPVRLLGDGSDKLCNNSTEASISFPWPNFLCYVYDSGLPPKLGSFDENKIKSSSAPDELLNDLLSFSEYWAMGHNKREQMLSAQRDRQNAEDVAPTPHIVIDDFSVNNRSGVYGDSHGLQGIYPTPPDAVSIAAAHANVLAPSPLQNMDVNTSHPTQQVQDFPSTGHESNAQLEADANEDLFGDMNGSDDFAGNDITDADFNFFDEDAFVNEFPAEDLEAVHRLENPTTIEESDWKAENLTEIPLSRLKEITGGGAHRGHIPVLENKVQGEGRSLFKSLDPEEVVRRLFSSSEQLSSFKHSSMFDAVKFKRDLMDFHERYAPSGAFDFKLTSIIPNKRQEHGVPPASPTSPEKLLRSRTFSSARFNQDFEDESDGDSVSIIHHPAVQSYDMLLADKTADENNDNESTDVIAKEQSRVTANMFEQLILCERKGHLADKGRVQSPVSVTHDWDTKSVPLASLRLTKRFVVLTQLITEQITHSTLVVVSKDKSSAAAQTASKYAISDSQLLFTFQRTTMQILGSSEECGLVKYAAMLDSSYDQQPGQRPTPRPSHPKGAANVTHNGIAGMPLHIVPQYIRVKRNDILWDVRASAIPFWEILGLGPVNGVKNISTYAIFPDDLNLEDVSNQILNDIGQCYENSKLGRHVIDQRHAADVIAIDPFQDEYGEVSSTFLDQCTALGAVLAGMDHERWLNNQREEKKDNVIVDTRVIYFINPYSEPTALHSIVSAFYELQQKYKRHKVKPGYRIPNVVLQIIPVSQIRKAGEIVLLDNQTVQMLAREVYNRCPIVEPVKDTGALSIPSASSIQLMDVLPRKIPFELAVEAPSNLTQDPSHLHLGYAVSRSGNWVTASYSDTTGKYQAVVSYCLTGPRTFFEVAKEMWETSIDIMKARRVSWRLCILKTGQMSAEEMDAWINLSSAPQPFTLVTVLSSLDLDPPISLIPQVSIPTTPPAWPVRNSVPTPAGTPNPQPGVSPDQSVQTPAAGTPSEHGTIADMAANDPDAYLVDMTDETWGVILGHRVTLPAPSPTSQCEFVQALSTALLFRVPPSTPATNPFNPAETLNPRQGQCIAIHLLWARNSMKGPPGDSSVSSNINPSGAASAAAAATANPSSVPKAASDNIMRESLGLLRNLALLAKIRGIKDNKTGLVPWHALVAEKVVDGLDCVYGMERWVSKT